jgi:hypothetical protein
VAGWGEDGALDAVTQFAALIDVLARRVDAALSAAATAPRGTAAAAYSGSGSRVRATYVACGHARSSAESRREFGAGLHDCVSSVAGVHSAATTTASTRRDCDEVANTPCPARGVPAPGPLIVTL